jgi:hypothetical protein
MQVGGLIVEIVLQVLLTWVQFNSKDHVEEGVYVASVGARFERPEYMESQHILISEQYNTQVPFGFDGS